ncbi:unnamed protein product [Pedinophyceae sp. YPF-701]|nr:unnamed protein product [Pedinophyceae sp. YPF-701]
MRQKCAFSALTVASVARWAQALAAAAERLFQIDLASPQLDLNHGIVSLLLNLAGRPLDAPGAAEAADAAVLAARGQAEAGASAGGADAGSAALSQSSDDEETLSAGVRYDDDSELSEWSDDDSDEEDSARTDVNAETAAKRALWVPYGLSDAIQDLQTLSVEDAHHHSGASGASRGRGARDDAVALQNAFFRAMAGRPTEGIVELRDDGVLALDLFSFGPARSVIAGACRTGTHVLWCAAVCAAATCTPPPAAVACVARDWAALASCGPTVAALADAAAAELEKLTHAIDALSQAMLTQQDEWTPPPTLLAVEAAAQPHADAVAALAGTLLTCFQDPRGHPPFPCASRADRAAAAARALDGLLRVSTDMDAAGTARRTGAADQAAPHAPARAAEPSRAPSPATMVAEIVRRAAAPLERGLRAWLGRGDLPDDPCSDFFVDAVPSVRLAASGGPPDPAFVWTSAFQLLAVPAALRDAAEHVLREGVCAKLLTQESPAPRAPRPRAADAPSAPPQPLHAARRRRSALPAFRGPGHLAAYLPAAPSNRETHSAEGTDCTVHGIAPRAADGNAVADPDALFLETHARTLLQARLSAATIAGPVSASTRLVLALRGPCRLQADLDAAQAVFLLSTPLLRSFAAAVAAQVHRGRGRVPPSHELSVLLRDHVEAAWAPPGLLERLSVVVEEGGGDGVAALDALELRMTVGGLGGLVLTQDAVVVYSRALVFLLKVMWAKHALLACRWPLKGGAAGPGRRGGGTTASVLLWTMSAVVGAVHDFATGGVLLEAAPALARAVARARAPSEVLSAHAAFLDALREYTFAGDGADAGWRMVGGHVMAIFDGAVELAWEHAAAEAAEGAVAEERWGEFAEHCQDMAEELRDRLSFMLRVLRHKSEVQGPDSTAASFLAALEPLERSPRG